MQGFDSSSPAPMQAWADTASIEAGCTLDQQAAGAPTASMEIGQNLGASRNRTHAGGPHWLSKLMPRPPAPTPTPPPPWQKESTPYGQTPDTLTIASPPLAIHRPRFSNLPLAAREPHPPGLINYAMPRGPSRAWGCTWVHSPVAGAADCRSAGPWFKSGCALACGVAPRPRTSQAIY